MLVAMAGLPATGKSTLAARLARELGAVVLDKDRVRAVLFPPPVLDYSREQDDVCMAAIYRAAACILGSDRRRTVILDGRTFAHADQVHDLSARAAAMGEVPRIIECVCADEVARRRLEEDQARGAHPAGNRTVALYLALKAEREPIHAPRLVLDTGALSPEECLGRCRRYLSGGPPPS
jgi:predicted kinase